MPGPKLSAQVATADAFLAAYRAQIEAGGLFIPGATLPATSALGECTVELQVASEASIEFGAQLASIVPGHGVAVFFPGGPPEALQQLLARLTMAPPKVPANIFDRLKDMPVAEKMQLGLSGDREARLHLLRDNNKAVHLYVLRNPRIGLDEVMYGAKLASLAPDALKFIAEHRDWGMNAGICAALARNPKIAVPLVLKILPRVPMAELKAIAKGSGRQPIVHAARKLLIP